MTRRFPRILRPVGINLAGKCSSAVRDLSPLLFFGVGQQLDRLVLASLVGATLAGAAISTSSAICIPPLARGEPGADRIRRAFVLVFIVLGVLALVGQTFILTLLGLEPISYDVAALYRLSVLSAVLQAYASSLAAPLFAFSLSDAGLAIPFFAGIFVPIALTLRSDLVGFGAALVLGGVLDIFAIALILRRRRRDVSIMLPIPKTAHPRPVAPYGYLALAQVVATTTIFSERAIMSRGGVGVVSSIAVAARVQSAIIVLSAGSFEPRVIRGAAVSLEPPDDRWARLARTVRSVGLLTIPLVVVAVAVTGGLRLSLLTVALAAYGIALPSAIAGRLLRAHLLGRQGFRIEFALMVVGSVFTIGLAIVALRFGRDTWFATSVPISSAAVAMAAATAVLRSVAAWRH